MLHARNKQTASGSLKPAGSVCARGNTTRTSGVGSVQIVGLQISQAGDATKRNAATAIGRTGCDGVAQIGVASLHANESALLGTTQNARIVGEGLNVLAPFGGR
jgi:hypothetical protein